jgi:hypothetical protein
MSSPTDAKQAMQAIHRISDSLLQLYQAELDAPKAARSKATVSSTEDSGVYHCNLEVSVGGQVKNRDVTISFCTGGQKTTGYTVSVASDTIQSITIPSQPPTNIDEYAQLLEQKKAFSRKMAPFFEHASASVGCVLNQLPQFQTRKKSSAEHSEESYLKLLQHNKSLQSYLKVGDTFAFFADLSDFDLFLHQIIKIHAVEHILKEEQAQILNSLWDQGEIESLFDESVSATAYRINEIFLRVKNDLDRKIRYRKDLTSISDFTKRNWFIEWLHGGTLDRTDSPYPVTFIEEIEQLFTSQIERNQPAVNDFNRAVKAFLVAKNYEKNTRHIEGMINNTLSFMTGIYKAQTVCRALQPENLFIKKKDKNAQISLSASGTYSVGIIDATSCVMLDRLNTELDELPPYSGLSAYATPSHFMGISQIKIRLGDPVLILRMQDIFATIGVIYYTATGKTLFIETDNDTRDHVNPENDWFASDSVDEERFQHLNGKFWDSTENELQSRLTQNESLLSQLSITIPDRLTQEIRGYVLNIHSDLETILLNIIQKQKFFKHPKLLKAIEKATASQIHQTQTKWSDVKYRPEIPPAVRKQIISWLKQVERIKRYQQYYDSYATDLTRYYYRLSALSLLALLFNIVYRHMNPENWLKNELILSKIAFAKE